LSPTSGMSDRFRAGEPRPHPYSARRTTADLQDWQRRASASGRSTPRRPMDYLALLPEIATLPAQYMPIGVFLVCGSILSLSIDAAPVHAPYSHPASRRLSRPADLQGRRVRVSSGQGAGGDEAKA